MLVKLLKSILGAISPTDDRPQKAISRSSSLANHPLESAEPNGEIAFQLMVVNEVKKVYELRCAQYREEIRQLRQLNERLLINVGLEPLANPTNATVEPETEPEDPGSSVNAPSTKYGRLVQQAKAMTAAARANEIAETVAPSLNDWHSTMRQASSGNGHNPEN